MCQLPSKEERARPGSLAATDMAAAVPSTKSVERVLANFKISTLSIIVAAGSKERKKPRPDDRATPSREAAIASVQPGDDRHLPVIRVHNKIGCLRRARRDDPPHRLN